MRDGNEKDLLVPCAIDNAEREAWDQTSSESSGHRRTGSRRLSNAFGCLFDGDQEPKPEAA